MRGIILLFFLSSALLTNAQSSALKAAERCLRSSTIDSAIFHAKTNLHAVSPGGAAAVADAYCLLGRLYNEKSSHADAERVLDSAISLAVKAGNPELAAKATAEKGRTRQLMKDPAEALRLLLEAHQYFESSGEHEGLARVTIYLAEYYRNLARFDDASTYIRTAMSMHRKKTFPPSLEILLYNRAAAIKSETQAIDSALHFSRLALNLAKRTGDNHAQAVSLNEIAFLYENMPRLQDAIAYYKMAEEIWARGGYTRYWTNAAENRARCYAKAGDRLKSNELLKSIADTLQKQDWIMPLLTVYEQMSRNYRELNDWSNADKYYIKFMEADVKLYKKEHAKELEEVKTRYETEKIKGQVREQQNQLRITELGYRDEKLKKTMATGGAILLLVVLAIIGYMLVQRSRLNAELIRKNSEVIKVNAELEASLNKSKMLMREVHHRVKNNLQIISSMFNLQADSAENETVRNILQESDNRVMMIAYLHERLYAREDMSSIEVRAFITQVIDNIFQSYNLSSHIHFESEIDPINVEMDKAVVMGIITNELVTNSVKHAFEPGQRDCRIRVAIGMRDERVFLRISDNGKGLPQGFSVENSRSFGLKLVNIMTQHVNGRITTGNTGGTVIEIEF